MTFPQTRLTLIQRLAAGGSEEDWRGFLTDYWGPICRFAMRFGARNTDDAEDVASKTFEVLWGQQLLVRWASNRSAKLRTLLCTVVRNILSQQNRVRAGREQRQEDLAQHVERLNEGPDKHVDAFYAAWVEDIVHRAVDSLAADYCRKGQADYVRVLYGRLCEGMSIAQVAEALSISPSAVDHYFRGAKECLAEKLEQLTRCQVQCYCPAEDAPEEFATEWQRLGRYLAEHGGIDEAVRRDIRTLGSRARQETAGGWAGKGDAANDRDHAIKIEPQGIESGAIAVTRGLSQFLCQRKWDCPACSRWQNSQRCLPRQTLLSVSFLGFGSAASLAFSRPGQKIFWFSLRKSAAWFIKFPEAGTVPIFVSAKMGLSRSTPQMYGDGRPLATHNVKESKHVSSHSVGVQVGGGQGHVTPRPISPWSPSMCWSTCSGGIGQQDRARAPLSVLLYGFCHFGFWHLVLNMWVLWVFGNPVNRRLGNGLYLLVYLGCLVAVGLFARLILPVGLVGRFGGHLCSDHDCADPDAGGGRSSLAYLAMFPLTLAAGVVPPAEV